MVYQALEFVAERKVKAVRNKGLGDAAAEDDDEFDDEEHFLALDDTLEGMSLHLDIFYLWQSTISNLFIFFTEGTGIDLEEDDVFQDEPLPARLPATLLALEDTALGEGDGEAGNYRVRNYSMILTF